MKKLITVIFILSVFNSFSQKSDYEKTMLAAIEKMNSSESQANFQETANIFERISLAEKSEWLPLYYAAYLNIVIGHQEPELTKKDPIFDKAQNYLDKAFKIAPNESELFALQAFLYPGRMVVDPMARGMVYMDKLNVALDKAIEINPDNPRSYYLRGIMVLNMPESFGGGVSAARPILETAEEKFKKFKTKSAIHPHWGEELNKMELEKIGEN